MEPVVIFNTRHAFVEVRPGLLFVPGINKVDPDSFLELVDHPAFKLYQKAGMLRIDSKMLPKKGLAPEPVMAIEAEQSEPVIEAVAPKKRGRRPVEVDVFVKE